MEKTFKNGATINNNDAMDLMKEKDCIIVDVRTPGEYERSHIKGAINFYLGEFESNLEKKFPNKDSLILVHCTMGNMSRTAVDYMVYKGYKRVYDIGGVLRWAGEIESTF